MSGEVRDNKNRMWAEAMERDRAKRRREGAMATHGKKPRICPACNSLIATRPDGQSVRAVRSLVVTVEISGDGTEVQDSAELVSTQYYHRPCWQAVCRHLEQHFGRMTG